ncbi:MAG: hypothetical protein GYB68_08550 [Chloroflexi bacterium]|nr:hypothetical protein [Chloroflexota bacterium]
MSRPYDPQHNVVTWNLLKGIRNRRISRFISSWDQLEKLVIRVYRNGQATREDRTIFAKLQRQLKRRYPRFADQLAPYWRSTTINGEPLEHDPFLALLAPASAQAFVENWPMMQTLPAVRQSLNEWLLDSVTPSADR